MMSTVTHEKNALEKGIELFNDGKYFEAHEAWEGAWLNAREEEEMQFYQGLIMAAGAFLHYSRRECTGANALLLKSIPMIQAGISLHPRLRLPEFIQSLDGLKTEFGHCSYRLSDVPLPRIGRVYVDC
jgi:predicted metal-dependent hydrolase